MRQSPAQNLAQQRGELGGGILEGAGDLMAVYARVSMLRECPTRGFSLPSGRSWASETKVWRSSYRLIRRAMPLLSW